MGREPPEVALVESEKNPGLSALALSACYTFLEPVINFENMHHIYHSDMMLSTALAFKSYAVDYDTSICFMLRG